MDIEMAGKKVNECTALRGKVNNLINRVDELKGQISVHDKEIAKLKSLQDVRNGMAANLVQMETELTNLNTELNGRVKALEAEGWGIPPEVKPVNRSGKL